MNSLIKRFISRAVRHEWFWSIFSSTVLLVARYGLRERSTRGKTLSEVEAAVDVVAPDLTVQNGVFKGMRYPSRKALGSTLIPKLLGSYEQEIQPALLKICDTNYSEIIDIGCAEGYYAVGLALRLPGARVFAYDTNPRAQELCRQMGELNQVSERLTLGSLCDTETLKAFPYSTRALIVSDCEGFEKQLFTQELSSVLAPHDLLIEIHDHIDIEISTHITQLFSATHNLEVFKSIDDIDKALEYTFSELDSFNLATRKFLLAENRPCTMKWFFLTSRSAA